MVRLPIDLGRFAVAGGEYERQQVVANAMQNSGLQRAEPLRYVSEGLEYVLIGTAIAV
jgi:hypothetical protein